MNALKGLKIAILVADGFEQVEMVKPRNALQDQGAATTLISLKPTVQGHHHADKGDTFSVDLLLDRADPTHFDALLLPGGVLNPDTLRMETKAIDFIKKIHQQKKPIAAICHGPWLLINAGIAKNHHVTSWPSVKTDLINAGALWEDKAVVKDGLLITSRNPHDIPAFNKAIIELLLNTYKNKIDAT